MILINQKYQDNINLFFVIFLSNFRLNLNILIFSIFFFLNYSLKLKVTYSNLINKLE